MPELNELFFSEGSTNTDSEDNLIWKTVLRTGEWKLTPGLAGVIRKPMKVIRDGDSDPENRVISLSQILSSFEDGAFEHVTIPLAMTPGDHKDLARENTGFVKKLKIVDTEDGGAKLMAGLHFTEPDIKERVERGTIPNTSVGLFFDHERKSDAKKFPIALAHISLTHRPWIDGMEPFGVGASDDEPTPDVISSYEHADSLEWDDSNGLEGLKQKVAKALKDSLGLTDDYEVADIAPGKVKIRNKIANLTWITGFTVNDEDVAQVPPASEWVLSEIKPREPEPTPEPVVEPPAAEEEEEEVEPPATVPVLVGASFDLPYEDLAEASRMREQRLGQTDNNTGGAEMATGDALKNLNLADLPEDQRNAIQAALDENATLRAETRKNAVDGAIERYKELGLSHPGTLKTIRRILLSDDGSTAAILLADDDHKEKEKVTAAEIVDAIIMSLPKEGDKIALSAQIEPGDDTTPPPASDDRPVEDRLKDARELLYGTAQ